MSFQLVGRMARGTYSCSCFYRAHGRIGRCRESKARRSELVTESRSDYFAIGPQILQHNQRLTVLTLSTSRLTPKSYQASEWIVSGSGRMRHPYCTQQGVWKPSQPLLFSMPWSAVLWCVLMLVLSSLRTIHKLAPCCGAVTPTYSVRLRCSLPNTP